MVLKYPMCTAPPTTVSKTQPVRQNMYPAVYDQLNSTLQAQAQAQVLEHCTTQYDTCTQVHCDWEEKKRKEKASQA